MKKLIFIIILIILSAPAISKAQQRYVVTEPAIAGITEIALVKAMISSYQNNYKELSNLTKQGLIVVIKPGTTVEIIEEKEYCDEVRIMIREIGMELWTSKDNLTPRWFY